MTWGASRRPKIKYGNVSSPNKREGSDGDIQIRQTNLGAKLFGKVGGIWYGAPLTATAGDPVVKIGTNLSDHLAISRESIDVYTGGVKVATFGATTTVADINLTGKIIITSTGTQNVCIGDANVNDLGTDNVAIGVGAGSAFNGDALSNVCIGTEAGDAITEGENNVCIGKDAGDLINSGDTNICIGTDAGGGITTGTANVFVGHDAGGSMYDKVGNVGIGYNALGNDSSFNSAGNVCIGFNAGDAITTSDDNVCIGKNSDSAATGNVVAIGSTVRGTGGYAICIGTGINAAEEVITMGQTSDYITVDFGENASWSHSSDIRRKRNIQDNTLGLSFIDDLKTRTFQWKPMSERPVEWGHFTIDENDNKVYHENDTDVILHGFIAQEVKESLDKESCFTFKGWSESEHGEQRIAETEFITPLVKAVQELSAKVDTMQEEINNLKQG